MNELAYTLVAVGIGVGFGSFAAELATDKVRIFRSIGAVGVTFLMVSLAILIISES